MNYSLLNQIKDILFETDVSGNLTVINEAFEKITGENEGRFINKPIDDLLNTFFIGDFKGEIHHLLVGNYTSFSHILLPKSKTKISKKFYYSIFRVEPENEPFKGLFGRISELQELASQNTNSRIGNQLAKKVLANISDIYIYLDVDGIIREISPSVTDLLQFTPEELLGRKAAGIIFPNPTHEKIVKILEEYQAAENFETYINSKSGHQKFVSMDLSLVKQEVEGGQGVNVIVRDISGKRERNFALEQSEERYRKLSSLTYEGILIHYKGMALDMNDRYAEMLGYKKEEIIGQNIVELTVPKKWHPLVKQNIEIEYSKPYEIEGIRKDGSIIPVEIQSKSIYHKGKRVRVVAVRDITNRKKAENQIRETELKYQKLFESSSDGIAICGIDGKILETNDAFCRMLQYSKEEIISKTFIDITPKKWYLAEKKIIESQLYKNGFTEEYEKEYIKKDGTVFPVSIKAIMLYNQKGEPEYMWGIVRDITEKKNTEIYLKHLNDVMIEIQKGVATKFGATFFDTIVTRLAKAIQADITYVAELFPNQKVKTISMCQNGKITEQFEYSLVNTPCDDVLDGAVCCIPSNVIELFPQDDLLQEMNIQGYIGVPLFNSLKEPIGIMVALYRGEIPEPKFASAVLEIFSARAGTEIERMYAEAQLKDSQEKIKKLNSQLEKRVKERTQELQNTVDKLKATQTQLVQSEKMVSLGVLTAGIAHEINNPVNFINAGIIGLKKSLEHIFKFLEEYEKITPQNAAFQLNRIKELKDSKNFEQVKDLAQKVSEDINLGAKRTAEIVRELRTFSRVDENLLKVVQIHDGLDSTLLLLRNQYKDRIEVVKHYDKLPLIPCYPGKLNQVFMNLILNGIQAISGEGTITIESKNLGDEVSIKISDTGCGIPGAVKEKIFEPFFTTKEVGKGTGLGLSISHSIINEHHGRLEFESIPDKGTTFVIYLPTSKTKYRQ
ncbi:PAS domain S-box protein [Flexithrix dorotheae]|uniref:PAS domain S-box protein n=1 Tax=Flexithrix dorotheae TaxID=70993 RepID=UPI0003633741|nr:PAS domain S-box protein [Flexithrix dorotheae]